MLLSTHLYLGGDKDETDDITKSSSAESIHQSTPIGTATSTPIPPRTASIRQRPSSTRINHTALEELFQKQKDNDAIKQNSLMTSSKFQGANTMNSPTKGRVYASVAEMKRNKSKVRHNSFTGCESSFRDAKLFLELYQKYQSWLLKFILYITNNLFCLL